MNKIDNKGAMAFAKALEINNGLEELLLNRNFIHADGITALARSLALNRKLRTLNLAGNNTIGNDTIVTFSQSIKNNTSLRNFELPIININGQEAQNAYKSLLNDLQRNNKSING